MFNKLTRRDFLKVLGLGSASAAFLAACGSSTESTTTETASTEPAAEDTSATTGTKEIEQVEVQAAEAKAELVNVMINRDEGTMAPWSGNGGLQSLVFETLGAFSKYNAEFVGILMKDWKQIDSKTYECYLYENITDSNGNAINANDVKFSWESCWAAGDLAETQAVGEVKVIDDYTVQLIWTADAGLGAFETLAGDVYIVSQASFEASEDGMITTPVGTGAYTLTEYTEGVSREYTARDDYWQSIDLCSCCNQIANVTKVHSDTITETSQVAMALQTGKLDISAQVGTEDLASFDEGGAYAEGHAVYSYPAASGSSLIPNCSSDSPCGDENLRMAIFYAIDQAGCCAMANGGKCKEVATFGGTEYSDYNEAWNDTNFPYDLNKAKEYLANSAYPDGCELTCMVMQNNSLNNELALAIQAYLSELNITVNIATYPTPQYLPLEGDSTAWDLSFAGFSSNTGYIVSAWQKFLDGTDREGATKNFYNDPEFQTLVQAALSIDTHSQETCDAVVAYMQEHAVMKGLAEQYNNIVYNSNLISGIVQDPYGDIAYGALTYNV